jgi:hypothetical protein
VAVEVFRLVELSASKLVTASVLEDPSMFSPAVLLVSPVKRAPRLLLGDRASTALQVEPSILLVASLTVAKVAILFL